MPACSSQSNKKYIFKGRSETKTEIFIAKECHFKMSDKIEVQELLFIARRLIVVRLYVYPHMSSASWGGSGMNSQEYSSGSNNSLKKIISGLDWFSQNHRLISSPPYETSSFQHLGSPLHSSIPHLTHFSRGVISAKALVTNKTSDAKTMFRLYCIGDERMLGMVCFVECRRDDILAPWQLL